MAARKDAGRVARRAARKAAGVCVECGREPRTPTSLVGVRCREAIRLRKAGASVKEDADYVGVLVNPATIDKLYTADEVEFSGRMDLYKRRRRRPFPTWHEVLEVLKSLGYRKVAGAGPLPEFHRGRPGFGGSRGE